MIHGVADTQPHHDAHAGGQQKEKPRHRKGEDEFIMFKEDGGGHQKDHAYQHPRHRGGHATPKPCVKLRLLVRVGAGRLDGVGPLEIAVVQPCKHKVEYRAGHQYQEGQGHRAGVGEKTPRQPP